MDTNAGSPMPEIIGMDKPNTSSAPTAILWITFVLALGLTIFLYMASRSALNAVEARTAQRDDLISELQSPSYAETEEKTTAFKQAFDILNTLATQRAPKKEILDSLYQNFTKDVYIRNLSISETGTSAIEGATGSYRSVADFMVALKQNKRVKSVSLGTVSIDSAEGVADNMRVVFSLTVKLDLAKQSTSVLDTTSAPEADSAATSAVPADAGSEVSDSEMTTTSPDATTDSYGYSEVSPSDAANLEGGL